ncbi:MAG: contact-dependent growth inhibition system immunity protein [Steroidobacteraceae bacterium]|jgi:hypothetical protein
MKRAEQHASVYLTRRGYFVHSDARTDAGFLVATLPAYLVKLDLGPGILGERVLEALAGSRIDFPTPRPDQYREMSAPVLAVAGVRSWMTLQRSATLCTLTADGSSVAIEPTLNGGSTGEGRGYRPLATNRVMLPVDASADAIGNAVIESFAKCK